MATAEKMNDKGDTGPKGDKGDKGDTGPQGQAGQGVEFGHLIVIEHVINENGNTAKASDYTIYVNRNNQVPDTFQGSEDGADVTLEFGSYSVSAKPAPGSTHQSTGIYYSEDCSGVIHPKETKTCTIISYFNQLA
jgi:hypothetical protein